MLQDAINEAGWKLMKMKDKWILETLEKHNLITSGDLSNFDIFSLREEMGVKLVNEDNKTKIYTHDKLIGEWEHNYQFVKEDDDNYKIITNCWN